MMFTLFIKGEMQLAFQYNIYLLLFIWIAV